MAGLADVVVVAGTDTGVGKTAVTGWLYRLWTRQGIRVVACKPFCSGGREDAEILHELQQGRVPLDRINPYWFEAPVTPSVAAREAGAAIDAAGLVAHLDGLRRECDLLLLEGAGGLLSPLGPGLDTLSLSARLQGRVACVLVAWNRLGVLNAVRLSAAALVAANIPFRVALNGGNTSNPEDPSVRTNTGELRRWLPGIRVVEIPQTPEKQRLSAPPKKNDENLKKAIASLGRRDTFLASFGLPRIGTAASESKKSGFNH